MSTTPITTTALWNTLASHTPCCHWDGPGIAAAVGAVLIAHGYPVTNDLNSEVLSEDARQEMSERLTTAAEALRIIETNSKPPNLLRRESVVADDLRTGDVVHETLALVVIGEPTYEEGGSVRVPVWDQGPSVMWFGIQQETLITARFEHRDTL